MLGGDFVQQILDHNGFVVFAMDFLDFFVVAEPYWRMLRLRSTRLNFINLIYNKNHSKTLLFTPKKTGPFVYGEIFEKI